MNKLKKWLLNVAVALDILINAISGGKERQTISGRLGSEFDGSIFELTVNFIFYKLGWWGDKNHCDDVAAEEKNFVE